MIRLPKKVLRRYFLMPLSCLALLPLTAAQANHNSSEPSDGTVRSFIEVKPPRKIAPFPFFDDQGRRRALAQFRGKIVLLNLWATWCPPCVREMPALDRLQAKFSKDEFVVIPLSLDRGGIPTVRSFFRQYGLRHLGIFVDPAMRAAAGLPVDVLPATFVIGRDGRMMRFLRSFVYWDDPAAEAMVRRLISRRQRREDAGLAGATTVAEEARRRTVFQSSSLQQP